jgi:DNA mismatch repair protein MutS
MMELSPMMKQYKEIKEQYQDCILFFRLGDFYEMFFEDALLASRELEITLTARNAGQEEKAPMCGVPYHSADNYIGRLVEKGYRVAICEQVEDPALAKGIVRREVTQVITPGTVVSQTMLNEKENNYLASLFLSGEEAGLAYTDISTGEMFLTDLTVQGGIQDLLNQLAGIQPREILINPELEAMLDLVQLQSETDAYVHVLPESFYSGPAASRIFESQFGVPSLQNLGIPENRGNEGALKNLLLYLLENKKQPLEHLNSVKYYSLGSHMVLDKATIRNLELTETLFDKKIQGSLLGVLDKTKTAMGSRKIRQWIREPLNRLEEIQRRLDGVEVLTENILLRNDLRELLKQMYDLERLSGRISFGNANGKDLLALGVSTAVLPDIKENLRDCGDQLLEELEMNISALAPIHQLIHRGIREDAGFSLREGGLIRSGYSEELDDMKESIRHAQEWISGLEGTERERTGIKNLKVGFNKVFGYYLEVTRSYYELIPENYIRKQTLANCERFITPELKEMESLVLNAETKINQLEYQLFQEIRDRIKDFIPEIQRTSKGIAELDALLSFAETGARNGYVKPLVTGDDRLLIEKGRHPVLEQIIRNGVFVSNDTYLDNNESSLLLITGPNMAGKSTYMRQTALIVLMAQIGCFVPCERAEIGITDRIFTRIGASDNLTQGQSTFYVEMSELAYILHGATSRSLIILDEIGRGTSTYDGLSIAWAVAEHLCLPDKRVRTLFATHYHELTVLEARLPGVRNLNVDVAEENGTIIFLHKIIEGSASRSYGIHVAKLAGVPEPILLAAEDKLLELESGKSDTGAIFPDEIADRFPAGTSKAKEEPVQLSFWGKDQDPLIQRIRELNLMEITPSQAISILEELKAAVE